MERSVDGKRTLVIGVGNPLRADDGVGVCVAHALAAQPLPKDVAVVDGGTGGLDLLFELEKAERVLLIDAAEMGCVPGEARTFSGHQVAAGSGARFASTHGFGVAEVLALARSVGVEPEVTVLGIEPSEVTYRDSLSETLAARVPEYVELARGLLAPGGEEPDWPHTQSKE
ncbi:MAG: hydrogenase maturation protease [Armatimonadetes bacterium]|nr:hydrogenase maturation protease [Armatimonadota bacterium]